MDPVLVLDDTGPHAEPGGETRVTATVHNVGTLVEEYSLDVLGDCGRWAQVSPRRLSVMPGEAARQTVEVILRPPAPPMAPVGTVPFALRCVSIEEPDRCAVAEATLTVGGVVGVRARLDPVTPTGRWTGRYRVVFDNTGSVPVLVRVSASDARRLLRFAVAPAELTVQPGRTGTAYVAVKPRQPALRGKVVAHSFTLRYRTALDQHGGELPATFDQRPIVGTAAVAASLVLAAAVGGAGLLVLRDTPTAPDSAAGAPPPPVGLDSAAASAAGSVRLSWTRSPYAAGYLVQQLLADGSVAGSRPVADRDQSVLTWTDLEPGRQCFQVLAVDAHGARSAPGGSKCATVTARPADTGSDPSAVSTATPTGQPTADPSGSGAPPEPVVGAYIVYGSPVALDDLAAAGSAERLLARLRDNGVTARLVDSRTSARINDGVHGGGLLVVLRDGFPDLASALAECAARSAELPCTAYPPSAGPSAGPSAAAPSAQPR